MHKPRLLFVCIENSNRSQMAEGFARSLGGERALAYSSGSRPSGQINPRAIEMMGEVGIDISKQNSNGLDDLPKVKWDWVVTMGCGDVCPFLEAINRDDWALKDPKNLDDKDFRAVRDEIKERVQNLLKQSCDLVDLE